MQSNKIIYLLFLSSTLLSYTNDSYANIQVKENTTSIAASNTFLDSNVINSNMLPRGSAMITKSGDLAATGISSIIHVAPGAMSTSGDAFNPTLDGVRIGLKNAIILAKENNIKSIALPFIGSSIFIHSIGITKKELAKEILQAIDTEDGMRKVMMVYKDHNEYLMFVNLKEELHLSDDIEIMEGSITRFEDHQAESIINAANMEVQFGGGVSGAIARATNDAYAIDGYANTEIKEFYGQFQSVIETVEEEVSRELKSIKDDIKNEMVQLENNKEKALQNSNIYNLKNKQLAMEKAAKEIPWYAYLQLYPIVTYQKNSLKKEIVKIDNENMRLLSRYSSNRAKLESKLREVETQKSSLLESKIKTISIK